MKLTKPQELALERLSSTEWQTAYNMGSAVGMKTLHALKRKGLVESRPAETLWTGWERSTIEWRKK